MPPIQVTEITPRFRDHDAMGHVNNAVYVTYLEVARAEWWRAQGLARSPRDFPFIIAEVQVTYRSPIELGERVRIEVRVAAVGNRSWTLAYRMTEPASGREVALAHTVLVAYDYAARRTQPIPGELRRRLEAALDPEP